MRRPEVTVAIIEDNGTRADLYSHWLDYMEVRVALTKQQVADAVDDDLTVVVLAEEFGGDGTAEKVLQLVRSRTRYCQVVTTTRDRSQVMPALDVDNHLTKPIFEADLREKVEKLARQTVFCEALQEYYRTSVELTTVRKTDEDVDPDEIERLSGKLADLKPIVSGLRAELDQDDMAVVANLVTREAAAPEDEGGGSSKYVPEKCFNCGRAWGVSAGTDPAKGAVRLGSQVWRCTECGHIQMGATAGNPRLTHHSR